MGTTANLIKEKIEDFFGLKDYEAIVGIDFGSSGTGYAFSLKEKNDDKNSSNEPKYGQIVFGQIPGASVNNKVPTEIILDKKKPETILAFGAECNNFRKTKSFDENCLYFKGIKMKLYKNQKEIEAHNTDHRLKLELVIKKILEAIKELATKEINKIRPNLEEKKIKWVVTVPAIWEESQKNIMMEACKGAKLVGEYADKSLFFALEPEAASMYCKSNKEIDPKYFEEGSYYIVCDLGGGTGDIVAHLVGNNNKLNEIYPSCGGDFGSDEIDKNIFEEIVTKLFGCPDFNSFCKKYNKYNKEDFDKAELFNDWLEFERQIKDFKEGVKNENIEKNEKYKINCSIFQDIYDSNHGVDIIQLVEEYNSSIDDRDLKLIAKKKKKWIIEFPYKIIYHYMKIQADKICKIINEINEKEKIKTIIFVGGYCNNEVILKLIKSRLNNIKIYLQPSNPSLAIMEGAVLFGIHPSTIDIRKAKYTLGEKMNDVWIEKIHTGRGEKYYNEDTKKWLCKDCFVKFITIGQDLKLGEKVKYSSYMCHKDQTSVCFDFYKTMKENPVLISEEGVNRIGGCTLVVGEAYEKYEDRELETIIKFGGTFIDVIGRHVKTGKEVKTILTFD